MNKEHQETKGTDTRTLEIKKTFQSTLIKENYLKDEPVPA